MYLPHRTVYKTEWDQKYKYHQQGILLITVKRVQLLAVWPGGSYFMSLCLSFLISKLGIVILFPLLHCCCENLMN